MTPSTNSEGRRSVRLRGHDYAAGGVYFLTICTARRVCLFGEIVGVEMQLSRLGEIARDCWMAIAVHHAAVELDAFVVMPNHVHGILRLASVGATHGSPTPRASGDDQVTTKTPPRGPFRRSVGAIVGTFKAASAREINRHRSMPGAEVWQRDYHDHVIRNDRALEHIRHYIAANPARWAEDPENPQRGARTARSTEPWHV